MKNLTKNLILFVSITLSFCKFIHAQQIDPPQRKLEYVTSEEYEVIDSSIKEYLGDTLPTYVAILTIAQNGPGGFLMFDNDVINITQINSPFSTGMRGFSGRGGFSGRVDFSLYRCTIKSDDSSKMLEFLYFTANLLGPGGSQTYYILANSEQQARQFTEAFIKCFDIETYNSLKYQKDELDSYRKIAREGQAVISQMETEYNDLKEQKNKLYKKYAKANYISDQNTPDIDNIVQVKNELAYSLREVDFELIGLDAKIESINKYKLSGTIIDDETLIKLNQILMATDIERAGVLARKQAFENSFKQAAELYDLITNCKQALIDLEKYKSEFEVAPHIVSQREVMFKNPRDMYQYIQIVNNKVTIKPVKQD